MENMDKSMMSGMQPNHESMQGGYKICINVDGQGAITVGVNSGDDEMGGGMESMQGAGNDRPVASIKEALQQVLAIYKGNGTADMDRQDEQAGFDKSMMEQ